MKSLRREVQFEETWLKNAFGNVTFKQEVTEALLDRVPSLRRMEITE